jgi:hypothetical protein
VSANASKELRYKIENGVILLQNLVISYPENGVTVFLRNADIFYPEDGGSRYPHNKILSVVAQQTTA